MISPFTMGDSAKLDSNTMENIKIYDLILRVPDPYVYPSKNNSNSRQNRMWDSFGFHFWMPDGSAVDYDPASNPGFYPKPTDPRLIETDMFMVGVLRLTSLSDPNAHPDPKIQVKNILGGAPQFYREIKRVGGSITIEPIEKSGNETRIYYGEIKDDNRYIIKCNNSDKDINPACSGDVRLDRCGLSVYVTFPYAKANEIQGIINITERLIYSWIVR